MQWRLSALPSKCQHACSISPSLLSSHPLSQIYIIADAALSISSNGSEVFHPLSLWASGSSQCFTKYIFVWDNGDNSKQKQSYYQLLFPYHITRRQTQCSGALCLVFPLVLSLIYGHGYDLFFPSGFILHLPKKQRYLRANVGQERQGRTHLLSRLKSPTSSNQMSSLHTFAY